ncbi:MAG TPA: hypothetical protein DIT07_07940 [Sphingobacteriaceae bacterium]|nr:hypothetical protein [Sphingobacteriaceae bacterium]
MRLILFLIVPAFLTLTAQAQHDKPDFKDIEMLKVKFLTDKLNLTIEEQQKFWPIYNDYQREMNSLRDQKFKNLYATKDNPQQNLSTDIQFDYKILNTKKKYLQLFETTISPQKTLALYQSEPEFREFLMRRIGHDRDGGRKFEDKNK